MKKIKKLFAVLLALTMVLGMTATVFAEGEGDPSDPVPGGTTTPNGVTYTPSEGDGTANDKGTIAIKGIEGTNATVTAYKIIKANYTNSYGGANHFSGYESLYPSVYTVTNGTNVTMDAAKVTEFLTAVKAATPAPAGIELTYDATEQAYMPNTPKHQVEIGTYLVVVEPTDTTIYNPMVVSVSYVSESDALNVQNTVLDISNPVGYAKASDAPTIDKTAKQNGTEVSSVNIGDTVDYEIVVSPIPLYKGSNPIFNVVDTLSSGLSIVTTPTDSVKVYVVDSKDAVINDSTPQLAAERYTATTATTANGQTLTVDFVKDGVYQLNGENDADAGKTLVIRYQATVNDKAAINWNPYTNTATLNYTRDSNLSGNQGKPNPGDEPKSTTYNYTFDLSGIADGDISKITSLLTKTGELTDGEVTTETARLSGAEFTLYTDAQCTTPYRLTNTNIPNGKVTSGENGVLAIRGLAAGNYWLKETKAPEGYSLNETAFPIVINAYYYGGNDAEGNPIAVSDGKEEGQLHSWTISFNGETLISGNVGTISGGSTSVKSITEDFKPIVNTHLSTLPSTGGIGTTIFTIGGCAIMIIAAGLYFATRRRTAK